MMQGETRMRPHPSAIPHLTDVSRWTAIGVTLGVGALYILMPDRLRVGPPWLLLAITAALLVPINLALASGNLMLTRALHFAIIGILTIAVATSAVLLVVRLPSGKEGSTGLLRDGALIWASNVLVFALWYWKIDCNGPVYRRDHPYHSTDFLFPQMTLPTDAATRARWTPDFMDYLFLAFNTSTAFSPTDTLTLSRRAKVLLMLQSLISLVVLAVLISRAINTLGQ